MTSSLDLDYPNIQYRNDGVLLSTLQCNQGAIKSTPQNNNVLEKSESEQHFKNSDPNIISTFERTLSTAAIPSRYKPRPLVSTTFEIDRIKSRFKPLKPVSSPIPKLECRSSASKQSRIPQCSQGPNTGSSASQFSQEMPSLPQYQLTADRYQPSFTPSPSKIRIVLRDLLMFLVIANMSLWLLTSLNGTAFTVYPYQALYFGSRVWVIITSITAPFCIFLKLHSSICLFKIWSFA